MTIASMIAVELMRICFSCAATFALIGEDLDVRRRIVGFTVQAVVKRVPIVLAPPLGGLLLERLGVRSGMRAGFAISVLLSVVMLGRLARSLRPEEEAPARRGFFLSGPR